MQPTRAEASSPLQTPMAPGRWGWLRDPWALTSLAVALVTAAVAAQPPPSKAKSVNELKAFYQQHCSLCHGMDGSALDAQGKRLGGLDFTKAAQDFKRLSGPGSEREIRSMSRTIQRGIFFGRSMPSWKDQLSLEDSTLMVKEILLKAEPGKAIAPGTEAVVASNATAAPEKEHP